MKITVDENKRITEMVKNCKDAREKHIEGCLLSIIEDLEFSQSPLCLDPEANVRDAILKLRHLATLQITTNEPCIRFDEAYHKQAVHEELNNKYIIVERLDMLIKEEKRKTVGLGLGIPTLLQVDAEALKAKLAGGE